VIQCLLPSAVTSLGSPAKLWIRLGIGALSALDQRARNRARRGLPAAPFLLIGPVSPASRRSVDRTPRHGLCPPVDRGRMAGITNHGPDTSRRGQAFA
jgi:hypothetical protein